MNFTTELLLNVIPNELWSDVISQYLTCKDLIAIYYYSYITYKELEIIFINKILAKLQFIFKENYKTLIQLIKNDEVCITGSFILQAILDKYYKSDIDFCCSKNFKNKCELFTDILGVTNKEHIHDYPGASIHGPSSKEKLINEVMTFYYLYQKLEPYIYTSLLGDQIIKGNYQSKKIQFIFLNEELEDTSSGGKTNMKKLEDTSLEDNINFKYIETFDISVIKNLLYFKNGKFNLYINDLDGIYNKTMSIDLTNTNYDRIEKYHYRDFTITGNNKYEVLQYMINLYNDAHVYKVIQDEEYESKILMDCIDPHGNISYKFCLIKGIHLDDIKDKSYIKLNLKENYIIDCFDCCYIKKFFGNLINHDHIIPKGRYNRLKNNYSCDSDDESMQNQDYLIKRESDVIIY